MAHHILQILFLVCDERKVANPCAMANHVLCFCVAWLCL